MESMELVRGCTAVWVFVGAGHESRTQLWKCCSGKRSGERGDGKCGVSELKARYIGSGQGQGKRTMHESCASDKEVTAQCTGAGVRGLKWNAQVGSTALKIGVHMIGFLGRFDSHA